MKISKKIIFQNLKNDPVLQDLVGEENIMYARPQQTISVPSIVFWEVSGTKDRLRNFENEIFQIDIYAEENMDDIAERVDEILDGKRFRDEEGKIIVVWLEQIIRGEDFEADIFHKYIRYRVVTNLNR